MDISQPTLFTNCNIIDIRSGAIQPEHSILVDQGIIQGVIPENHFKEMESSRLFVMDCQGGWVIPGLIDLHVHLCEEPDPILAIDFRFDEEQERAILRAQKNASAALKAGVTLLRDLGSFKGRSIIVRDILAASFLPAPTILSCGEPLTSPNGHLASHSVQGRGAERLRDLVKQQIDRGADLIKVMLQGEGFKREELAAIVDEAHQRGVKVACHAYLEQCVEDAIEVGADTIEHTCELSDDALKKVIERKIIIVPTLVCAVKSCGSTKLTLIPDNEMSYFTNWLSMQQRGLTRLIKSSIMIGAGTDAGFPPIYFDDIVAEIELFTLLGMNALKSLQTATCVAAEAIGEAHRFGEISKSKAADFLILKNNPLLDVRALRGIRFVVKAGELVVDNSYDRLLKT